MVYDEAGKISAATTQRKIIGSVARNDAELMWLALDGVSDLA
jgi:hypothetical protein